MNSSGANLTRRVASAATLVAFFAASLAAGCAGRRWQRTEPGPARPQAEVAPPNPQLSPTRAAVLDQADDLIAGNVRRAAAWIDSLLSDERSVAEGNRSWIALRSEAAVRERQSAESSLRVDGRLVLPNTQERLHLLLGDELTTSDDDPSPLDPSSTRAPDQSDDPILALQLLIQHARANDLRFELGARFEELDPDPYAGARWRHSAALGHRWLSRFIERVRLYQDAGLESKASLDCERGDLEAWLFRSSTTGRWRDSDPGVTYGQRFAFYRPMSPVSVLVYEWATSFVTDAGSAVDETTLRVRLARRYSAGRILFELAPELSWRAEDSYAPSFGIVATFELAFGRDD